MSARDSIALSDPALERRYLAELLYCGETERGKHLAAPERAQALDCASALHGRILGAIHELSRAGDELSPITVRKALEQSRSAQALGALDALLDGYEPQLDSLAVMSARIVELAQARRVREHLMRGVAAAERLHVEAAQESAREAIGHSERLRVDIGTLHSSALIAVAEAQKAAEQSAQRCVPFGYELLDQALKGGMRRATMAIFGGRTGAGKSSLMLGAAIRQASRGLRVGVVSCEDSAEIWGERALAHFSSVDVEQLLTGQLDMHGDRPLERALQALKRLGVHMAYALNRPLEDVLAAMRALISDGAAVVYVDYVQAIRLGHKADRKDLVREATQRLKAECQQAGVVLVLGSQLSRADKRDRFGEPHESDLKETGDLENMTEVVVLLWKSSDSEDGRALGKITKVKWSPRRPRFELVRTGNGALSDVRHYDGQGNGHASGRGDEWA